MGAEDLMSLTFLSLLLGSLYSMIALGITMTYSIAKFANFAHAEFVTIGAYMSVMAINYLGIDLAMATSLSFLCSALIALSMDELIFRPLFNRGASPLYLLVASIGVSLALKYTLSVFADLYGMLAIQPKILPKGISTIMGAYITELHAYAICALVCLVTSLHFTLTNTKMGKAIRATACNSDLAQISGINTDSVRRIAWIIAGGLAGLSGMLWSLYSPTTPEVGSKLLLRGFATSILGGMTSFYGTLTAGIIVGFAENFGISLANRYFGVDLAYRLAISLIIIAIVLVLRPTGLLAEISLSDLREKLGKLTAFLKNERRGDGK